MMLWLGISAAFAAPDVCADEALAQANSEEIKAMFEAGEEDRSVRSADAVSVLERDEKRAKVMMKYDKKAKLCTPQDKWYAAWMMQQSDDLEVLTRAYELAIEAMEGHADRGPWLVAFAFDHKRVAGGFRQSYATQTRVDAQGRTCLIHLEGDVTDEQRRQYGVETLQQVYRRVLDANGFSGDAPTEQRLKRNMLLCPPLAIKAKDRKRVRPPDPAVGG
ncbi:MAG: hypothetical protein KTR31_04530 [Myxococcales bacterium]|nr:hypothetical protein [Myxococcales bacterium]